MGKAKNKKKMAKSKSMLPIILVAAAALVVIILVVVIVGAWNLLPKSTPPQESMPLEISVAGAYAARESGAFILDVREQSEWDEFHIPGATLIPLAQLESRLADIPSDQEVVVVCRSGNRSATGRDILLNNGFNQVTSMAGGMNEWRDAGYEIATGR